MTAAAPSRIAASKVCVLQDLVLKKAARARQASVYFCDFERIVMSFEVRSALYDNTVAIM